MRGWIIPLFAVAVVAGSNPTYEPSELQMRAAFEGSLAAQVRNALEFAREIGGEEAVAKIRASGMDRFNLNAFQKLNCQMDDGQEAHVVAHVCAFTIDVELANGMLQKTISGRFRKRGNGFEFRSEV
jgi:hypothetical protein